MIDRGPVSCLFFALILMLVSCGGSQTSTSSVSSVSVSSQIASRSTQSSLSSTSAIFSSASVSSSRASASSSSQVAVNCSYDPLTFSRTPSSYPVNKELPNPFVFQNGQPVKTPQDWACRRKEISAMIQGIQYGPLPKQAPQVTATLSGSQLKVTVAANGKTASFTASFAKPSGNGPFPAFVVVGGGGFGMPGITSQVATSRGYAYVVMDANTVSADNGTSGAFYTLYGTAPKTGNIMAWAWGIHRIIDAFEQYPEWGINPEKTAVTGYSRYGKVALVAGAFDDRVALTVPGGSGHGGIANWRTGEDNDDKANKFNGCCETIFEIAGAPHWFTDKFVTDWQADNTYRLPFDAHEIAALVAPRALIVQEGTTDTRNGNATTVAGPYKSMVAAKKVYEFLGAGDKIGFVADSHGHGTMTTRELDAIMALAERALKDKAGPAALFDQRGSAPVISWDKP